MERLTNIKQKIQKGETLTESDVIFLRKSFNEIFGNENEQHLEKNEELSDLQGIDTDAQLELDGDFKPDVSFPIKSIGSDLKLGDDFKPDVSFSIKSLGGDFKSDNNLLNDINIDIETGKMFEEKEGKTKEEKSGKKL